MMEVKILFRDKHLVVAVKPQGVLSQPDLTGDQAMPILLGKMLGCEVYPVHRLDRAVGGVMIFALTKEMAGKLSALLTGENFCKEYLTIVDGIPQSASGELHDFLLHDKRRNMTSVVSENTKNGKKSVLSYEVLDTSENAALLRILLHTGRTHQIRVQFSSRGMPILGDGRYGSRARHPVALWAYRLSFVHPITRKKHSFQAFPEQLAPWDMFSALAEI